jgi:hypothetical protein
VHKSTQSWLEGVLRLGSRELLGIVCFENFDGFGADSRWNDFERLGLGILSRATI